jgi:hypothetical protein
MRAVWIFTSAIVAVVVGCQTPGGSQVSDKETEPGKRILYRKCATCHVLEPIENYSPQRWREIIGEMAPRANLSSAEENALMRYILSVHEGT